MDDSDRRKAEQEDIDKEESRRLFLERLSDWSEPGSVKINRNGKLLDRLVAPNLYESGCQMEAFP